MNWNSLPIHFSCWFLLLAFSLPKEKATRKKIVFIIFTEIFAKYSLNVCEFLFDSVYYSSIM